MDWSGIMRARKIRSVGFSQPRLLPRMLEADGREADAVQAEGVPTFLLRCPPGGGAGETHSCEAFDWTGRSRSRPAPRRPAPQPAGRKRPRCRPLPQRLAARGTGGSGCHRAAVTWPRGLGHVAAAIDPHCGPYGAQKPPGSSRGADRLTGLGGAPESPLPRPRGTGSLGPGAGLPQ